MPDISLSKRIYTSKAVSVYMKLPSKITASAKAVYIRFRGDILWWNNSQLCYVRLTFRGMYWRKGDKKAVA